MNPQGNAVCFFVDRHLELGHENRVAFVDFWRQRTYGELAKETSLVASALCQSGLGRERRVGLLLLDTVDFPNIFWGAMRAGIVPIPINTWLPVEQIGYILADARAEALFVSEPLLAPLLPLLPELPELRLIVAVAPDGGLPRSVEEAKKTVPRLLGWQEFLARGRPDFAPVRAVDDEVAFWLYSSGSTGVPKGVKHVHRNLRATAETYGLQVLGITAEDVVFSAAKLFFAYGLGNAMTFPMAVGAQTVLVSERPSPGLVLECMRRFQPSIFSGVPTLYAALLAHPEIGPGAGSARLRRCNSAGEALPEAVGRRWREIVGVDILDGIGSTEMLHIFISNRPDDVRYGATGKLVPGYRAKIVDESGNEVADGTEGELLVQGPSAAEGYWLQLGKTRQTFRGEWVATGDTFVRDAEGYYHYRGRSDDMMKVSGIWVSPFEVEAALMSHPAVLEAAVVGVADAEGLIKPKAFVVLTDAGRERDPRELTESLKEYVKERIGAWKYPRWIEIAESLPKTATGKIQRFKLRALSKA